VLTIDSPGVSPLHFDLGYMGSLLIVVLIWIAHVTGHEEQMRIAGYTRLFQGWSDAEGGYGVPGRYSLLSGGYE
jgi:hypothetical protein